MMGQQNRDQGQLFMLSHDQVAESAIRRQIVSMQTGISIKRGAAVVGTSLYYHSIQAVPEPARTAVIRELEARNANRTWWAEGIRLYDNPEKPEHIFGSTKLFLPGYGSGGGEHRKVLPRHDIVMAYCDGKYLVRTFQRLSRRYDITWCLEIEGNPFAVIHRGRLPRHARLQLIGFGLLARVMARSPFLRVSSRWISRRYADRW